MSHPVAGCLLTPAGENATGGGGCTAYIVIDWWAVRHASSRFAGLVQRGVQRIGALGAR